MKKLILTALAITCFSSPALACEHNKQSKSKKTEKNSLIGKNKVTEKVSVGSEYEPSAYPKSSYTLGTDGFYHYNTAAQKK